MELVQIALAHIHACAMTLLSLPCSGSSGFQSTSQIWSQGRAGKLICGFEGEANPTGGYTTTSHPSGRGGLQHSEGKGGGGGRGRGRRTRGRGRRTRGRGRRTRGRGRRTRGRGGGLEGGGGGLEGGGGGLEEEED